MGMRTSFNHYSLSSGIQDNPEYHVEFNVQTDDQDLYSRLVIAISKAMGYPEETVKKEPVMGFHQEPEVQEPEEGE